ncbi:MAG: class I SAM-dependent methyltransferase [Symplocastrum torsivum CPER-KK1]|jgi:SAM-dependent methyltransferase|uniref:Class I SAM-dependent methyltransferase n=1 Tax=Symplocastrum torsivum CPER-KK1 TaxID=450513 RepID=A0A951U7Q0_9CYAN|nr:class I SAM-dependent methyltransferase [Symplocastrum torsivum CPER-KK1]
MNQDKIWNYFQDKSPEVFLPASSRLNYLFKKSLDIFGDTTLTILNIGVGNGGLEKRCQEQGWETYALDPSQEAIRNLKAIGVKGEVGYIQSIPYADDFFDVVFCSEVIEHLSKEEINLGLIEISRILKKGGVLIGTVPYQENLIENQVVCPKCGEIFHRWGHQQSFDVKSLIRIFPKTLAVKTIDIIYFVDLLTLNWKGILMAGAKKGLSLLGIHGRDENLFFVLRKED